MENKLPILLATDLNTDVGIEAEKYNYGFWCESGNLREFLKNIELFCDNLDLRNEMGNNGYGRLKNDFSVDYSYSQIYNHLN
jgi:glycosyltransferase involved in cell wall biosynthesis